MDKRIYVADDEKSIRELIRSYLEKEGYLVEIFEDGMALLEAFKKRMPDMVVIDIMMPRLDGLELCREIRKLSNIPIVIVSAKDEEIDRIIGLELGGDDYIAKPFSPRELVIRIKNIFRRLEPAGVSRQGERIKCRDITLHIESRQAYINNDIPIEFTTKEFDLMVEFMRNLNRVFTREQLINSIWGYEFIGETRAVDDLVKRIRKKLNQNQSQVEIETVWGYGYKMLK